MPHTRSCPRSQVEDLLRPGSKCPCQCPPGPPGPRGPRGLADRAMFYSILQTGPNQPTYEYQIAFDQSVLFRTTGVAPISGRITSVSGGYEFELAPGTYHISWTIPVLDRGVLQLHARTIGPGNQSVNSFLPGTRSGVNVGANIGSEEQFALCTNSVLCVSNVGPDRRYLISVRNPLSADDWNPVKLARDSSLSPDQSGFMQATLTIQYVGPP